MKKNSVEIVLNIWPVKFIKIKKGTLVIFLLSFFFFFVCKYLLINTTKASISNFF
jgi:hypothetical protein